MVRKFIYIVLLLNSSSVFSQSMPDKCELDGNIFYTDCIKYIGDCQDNMANGWGDLYLTNNKILTGLFIDNILQDFHMDVFWADNNKYIFGPNKGSRFHGPCVAMTKDYVYLTNYDNGQSVGNSDYFNIPNLTFKYSGLFCDGYDGFAIMDTDKGYLIPNTNSVIYVSIRQGKRWISVVDLTTNKIIRNFGNYTTPLRAYPVFKGFASNNQFAYFDIRINEKEVPKFLKCNLANGISEIKNSLPPEILNKEKLNSTIKSTLYKEYGTLDHFTFDKFIILNDTSYVKLFNNKNYLQSIVNHQWTERGSGSSLVRYGKNREIINSIELKNMNIFDFAIDERSKRIALSYQGKDSTFLSYYDLNTFRFISNVLSDKSENPYPRQVNFSKTGTYLFYKLENGTAIYLGNKLYYGIPGKEVLQISEQDNVVISMDQTSIFAYDLEKKIIIWKYDYFGNFRSFNIDSTIYFISGLQSSGTGFMLNSFTMPKPLFSLKEFVKNPEEIASIKNNQIIDTKNKPTQQVNFKASSPKDEVLASYLVLKFLSALFESTSHPTSYPSSSNERQKQWVNCRRCHGSGLENCSSCEGKGSNSYWNPNGNGTELRTCTSCGGKGTRYNCRDCEGRGQVQE